jgi:hypothetical protein
VLNVQTGCRATEDEWPYHPQPHAGGRNLT